MTEQGNNNYGAPGNGYQPPYPGAEGNGNGYSNTPSNSPQGGSPYYGTYQGGDSPMGPTSSYLSRPSLSPRDSCEGFLRNYVKFDGRASKSEYWWPSLAIFVVSGVLSALSGNGAPPRSHSAPSIDPE